MDYLGLILKYRKVMIVTVVVLILLVWWLLRGKKNEQEQAISKLNIQPGKLTISDNQAMLIAENLLAAMNKYGTDENTILENLSGLNTDDLLLVMKKFGVKPYNGAGLATRGYEIKFFSSDLNLTGWFKRELSGSTLNSVAAIFEKQ